jgi:hypothetical protein
MTKEQFVKGLKYLGIAYNKEFDEEQATVWYDFFKDVDFEVFRQAVKRIIPKSKYIPSIAELRSEVAQITNPVLQLNVEEEWDNVIQMIRKYGSYITAEQFNELKPTTMKVVKTIGWRRLCMSENIEFERRTFYDMFNSYQKRSENSSLIQIGSLMDNERRLLDDSTRKEIVG